MATRDAVERRLWAAAQYRAAELGFAPDCEIFVRDLVRQGADRIAAEGFLNDEDRIAVAEANVKRFVSEMMIEARFMGLAMLHEPTFFKTLNSLCPMWPFC
ncbi:MAG: hypothetical protein FJ134_13730 [Deltaproteobacteria bacterium]|nr:hypothetical protein [Deltaproteobacteria bacterium]